MTSPRGVEITRLSAGYMHEFYFESAAMILSPDYRG